MKARLFDKLKQAYSQLGLGDDSLLGLAGAIAASGLVTEENLDMTVAAQKEYLEGLQRAADKRVGDALEKERRKHEEETRKADEERRKTEAEKAKAQEAERAKAEEADRRKAEVEQRDETRRKEGEEALAKANAEIEALREKGLQDSVVDFLKRSLEERSQREALSGQMLDKRFDAIGQSYETRFKSLEENSLKQGQQLLEAITALKERNEALLGEVGTLKAQNERAKADKAAAERREFINAKVRELGIPQWRQQEGFLFPDDATEETIARHLETVSNNIRTAQLPGSSVASFPLSDNAPSQEEMKALAKNIVK